MKLIFSSLLSLLLLTISCSGDKTAQTLFDGDNSNRWKSKGDLSLDEGVLSLKNGASMVLKKGSYRDFELLITARTVEKGKGEVIFHTDDNLARGYQVALNNDKSAAQWWTKTGSLLHVRNLTQSTVKDNAWFDMKIRVEGAAISVLINDMPVVEYLEPATPYRTEEHAQQRLSEGTFAVRSSEGTIEIRSVEVTPLNSRVDITHQQAEAIDESTDQIIRLHQENFPVLDYHVHLKGITAEQAATQSRRYGINYALAPNCGIGFPITSDEEVLQYLDVMRDEPFIQAMQGEGREWPSTFSEEVRNRFDFVFTDALTFTDSKGRRTRLWMPDEVFIEDEEAYMDLIVEKIVEVMQEPMDVYVNPTFLPEVMNDRYDAFWTDQRMERVIEAMVATNKALEINHRYKIPGEAFIRKAKEAGLKFTFGTNNADGAFGKMAYCIEMKEACGITAADMYKPTKKQ